MPQQDNAPVAKRYCHNCHYPLPGYGQYCPNCSQKYTDGRIKIYHLLAEFFESVFNIDSKIFRTIGHLFIPGKLTTNYFAGRQKRYIAPVRLFFVMAIIHFACINLIINNLESDSDGGLDNLSKQNQRESYLTEFLQGMDTTRLQVEKLFPEENVRIAIDSLLEPYGDQLRDSVTILVSKDARFNLSSKRISRLDLVQMPRVELYEKYNINGFWQQLQATQSLKIIDQGGNFTHYILGQMIWMVVLMMPALALILKLLYIRRKYYFVEHLVFSFHYHAFAFLLLTIPYFLDTSGGFPLLNVKEGEGIYTLGSFIILLIYLYMAMRRFYKQGRFKTFVKFNILNVAYLFIFALFLVLTLVVSALIF